MPGIVFEITDKGFSPSQPSEEAKFLRWCDKYVNTNKNRILKNGKYLVRLNLPSAKRSITTNNAFHGDFAMLAEVFGVHPQYIKDQSKLMCKEFFVKNCHVEIPGHQNWYLGSSSELSQDEANIWMKTYRENWSKIAKEMFDIEHLVWYENLEKQAEFYGY